MTRPSGSKHFYEAAGAADRTLQLYHGHFHDLLNDLDRELVMSDILDWMENRLPSRFPLRPIAPGFEIGMPFS